MFLTNSTSEYPHTVYLLNEATAHHPFCLIVLDIKEVLLFPAMKPLDTATVVPTIVGQVPGQEV